MASSVYPPVLAKRKVTTLTSGTSYTVPAGVTNLNVTLRGAGGGDRYRLAGGHADQE